MLSTKLICSIWLFLSIISEICSTEYLHFGGTAEQNKQAEYYLSADSGANVSPADEVIRTQRSFWKLFGNKGLFGNCGKCCNNCNYNIANENAMSSLLLPFKPLQPLPLWRPLEPLFGPLKHNNYGFEKYSGCNLNNKGNPSSYDVHTYRTDSSANNAVPTPVPTHGDPVESPNIDAGIQLDKVSIAHNMCDQSINSALPAYRNDETLEKPQDSNKNLAHVIYQPIIYVSSQYLGNKASHQHKQESYESGRIEAIKPYSQTDFCNEIPALGLSYTSTNPSVPSVSTFYNIITHPYTDSVINPRATSDYLPSNNYLLNDPPRINYLSSPNPSTHTFAPIVLTPDDQPYRVCPELFQDYQRKLNALLPHI